MNKSSIDYNEVAKFSKLSDKWWDSNGEFRTLHQINPIRLSFIDDKIQKYFANIARENLKVIDIGCGGGLIAEPLSKMGYNVTGIDASKENIDTASFHARSSGLEVKYECSAAENHEGKYDVVLALEIIEHVLDINVFIDSIAKLLNRGGIIIISTINRTPLSYLEAIVAAEYILNWVPKGTHEFLKFVKPSEIAQNFARHDMKIKELKGLGLDLLTQNWKLRDNINVSYFAVISNN